MRKINGWTTVVAGLLFAGLSGGAWAAAGCGGCPVGGPPKEEAKQEEKKVEAKKAAEFKEISLADLKQAIADGKVSLLDVNGSDSYNKGHLPGALDFSAVKETLADKLPKEKDALLVAYCGGPKCGAWRAGANAAAKLGYTNVQHYTGGLAGWKADGGTLVAVAKQEN